MQQRDRKRINKQQTITMRETRATVYYTKRAAIIPAHFLAGTHTSTVRNYQNILGA